MLLLTITENGWSEFIYYYSSAFENEIFVAFFFISFYLIVKIVLIALLTGLIWEIFTIISELVEKEKKEFNEKKAKIQNEVSTDKKRRDKDWLMMDIDLNEIPEEDEDQDEDKHKDGKDGKDDKDGKEKDQKEGNLDPKSKPSSSANIKKIASQLKRRAIRMQTVDISNNKNNWKNSNKFEKDKKNKKEDIIKIIKERTFNLENLAKNSNPIVNKVRDMISNFDEGLHISKNIEMLRDSFTDSESYDESE